LSIATVRRTPLTVSDTRLLLFPWAAVADGAARSDGPATAAAPLTADAAMKVRRDHADEDSVSGQ
jgi:hypothetical protein